MRYSARFRILTQRLAELRRHFLPKRFDRLGRYLPILQDHTRGFRLLAHSEIESYVEDRCREVCDGAQYAWVTKRRITVPLLSLLAYAGEKYGSGNGTWQAAETLDDRVDNTIRHYGNSLYHNNGIKERNLRELLTPIGIAHSDIDHIWLGTIDTFGSNRGDTAHTSAMVQVQIDPRRELQIVTDIVRGLRPLDQKLNRLLR